MKALQALLSAVLVAVFARPAMGQAGLEAAGGTTSLVARDFSSLTIEAAETSLTLLLQSGAFGLPTTWENNFRVKLSAEDGERDLFSDGRWVPGLELEERIVQIRNHSDTNGGYTAAFLSLGYEVKSNSLARIGDGSVIETYEEMGQTPTVGLGLNWTPGEESFVLGFSATAGRGFNVPVARRTSQLCTQQAAGTNEEGDPVTVSRCGNRYLGEVHDTRTGEFRVDVLSPRLLVRIGSGAEEARRLRAKVDTALGLSGNSSLQRRISEIGAREGLLTDSIAGLERNTRARREALEGAREAPEHDVAAAERALTAAQREEENAKKSLEEVRKLREEVYRAEELASNAPQVSLLASASTEVAEGAKPIHSIAFGPMLHPPFTPLKVIAGVLFELDDLTNATGDAPGWEDRFAIRLYIGVPF